MRVRALLLVSLAVNLVAGAGAIYYWQLVRHPVLPRDPPPPKAATASLIHTNVLIRRQNFSWEEIESPDYRAYIANLRSINCPESTIRDIIVADVNELFARRRATEIVTADQQWWRSEPDMDVLEAAAVKSRALEAERRALLTALLGPNWETLTKSPLENTAGIALDGPVLGKLSSDVKRIVYDIHARAARRKNDYIRQQMDAGKQPDPAELARLARETREELARYLNPNQMEEYLLRYSQTAENLRRQLSGLQISPEEFRSLFRIRDPIDQQINLYLANNDLTAQRERAQLEKQRDLALKQALGPERYNLYKFAQDPAFVQTRNSVEEIGAPADAVLPIYRLTQAAETEQARIQNDASLTSEQQAAALQNLLTQQQENLRKILGEEAYRRYLDSTLAVKGVIRDYGPPASGH